MPTDIGEHIELHAYLDDELDSAAAAQVQQRLAVDAAYRNEFVRLQRLKQLISAAYQNDFNAPVSASLIAATKRLDDAAPLTQPSYRHGGPTNSMRRQRYLALCASLIVGLIGGYFLAPHISGTQAGDTWVEQVANYHAMYTADTLQHVNIAPAEQAAAQQRLNTAVQNDITIPDLSKHGLTFKRSQVLTAAGNPVIQLAYLHDESSTPIALCLTPNDALIAPPAAGKAHDVNFVRWSDTGVSYVVVGHLAHDALHDIVKTATAAGILEI